MKKDSLGDRMKGNYEDRFRTFLPRRMPLILRLDGVAFHTLTKNIEKPFSAAFSGAMNVTAWTVLQQAMGAQCAYVQSDEISLLFVDYQRLTTEAWFDRNLQKTVSVAASMASVAFTDAIRTTYPDKTGVFDGRAFVLPKEEVTNYFIWRQQDAVRNSISSLAQANFSHKTLQNLNCNQMQEKLFTEKGVNWNDQPTRFKRGGFITRNDGIWGECPEFSKNRSIIEDLLKEEHD